MEASAAHGHAQPKKAAREAPAGQPPQAAPGSRRVGGLVAQQLDVRTSMQSSTPIPEGERCLPNDERMQKNADLTWFGCRTAIPLTLLAQRTRAATVDAGSIHHAQTARSFSALFMRDKLLVSRAMQCPIRLEHKVLTGEATCFPGQAHLGRSIAQGRRYRRLSRGESDALASGPCFATVSVDVHIRSPPANR